MKNSEELSVKELNSLLEKFKKRLAVSNHSQQTIVNYVRSVEYLCKNTSKHALPARFMKIRNYGFLSSRNKTEILERLHNYFKLPEYQKPQKIVVANILKLVYGVETGKCRHCGGNMILVGGKVRPNAAIAERCRSTAEVA